MHSGQDTEWFQDQRYLPQQQAQYLRKLSRLREDLIQQQHSVVHSEPAGGASTTLSDTSGRRDTVPKLFTPASVVKRKAFPGRGVRTHRDVSVPSRAQRLTNKLDPISGQQLVQPPSSRLSKSMDNIHLLSDGGEIDDYQDGVREPAALKLPYLTSPSVPVLSVRSDLSYEAVNDVIHTQRTRLKEVQNLPLNKPSIPLPTRKTGQSNGFQRGRTQEAFSQKIPLTKKTNRGLCRGKTNVGQFLHADTDEVQLPSNFYDLTLADIQHGGSDAPPTTPNVNKLQNSARSPFASMADYIPTIEEQELIHYQYHTTSPRDQARGLTRDSSKFNKKKHQNRLLRPEVGQCVFCDQERKSQSESFISGIHDLDNSSNQVTFDLENGRSPVRRHIVVDLAHIDGAAKTTNDVTFTNGPTIPHLTIHPASPAKPEANTNQSATSLIKTFKQNELRRREVSNLLEDVKELNSFTESLAAKY